jgi:hypothetical protein
MASPITSLLQAEEQHMLLLFLPLKQKPPQPVLESLAKLAVAAQGNDSRPSTGVHFFMTYHMAAGASSPIVVPTFQAAPAGPGGKPKDLLVVLSIYDRDFEPYIGSFLTNPIIVYGLTEILKALDEDGIVAPDDPTSAVSLVGSPGGLATNAQNFYRLLMRYNFADPTIPAIGPGGIANPPPTPPRYFLGATFPGLTVGKILDPKTGYPDAGVLWPSPEGTPRPPKIMYEPSDPPSGGE